MDKKTQSENLKAALSAAVTKLSYAYASPHSAAKESALVFAIIGTAIEDLRLMNEPKHGAGGGINKAYSDYCSAYNFIFGSNEIAYANLIGLDSNYIRSTINKCLNHFGMSIKRAA